MASLWEKLRDQEMIDIRLLIALPVVLVIGVVVFFWVGSGGSDIETDKRTFVCYFNPDITVELTNREVNEWKNRGDAIFPYDRRNEPPTRLKCPDCGRFACVELDPKTGELPQLSAEHVSILESETATSNAPSRVQPNN